MAILITGATGLIGKAIVKQCEAFQIPVHFLTTSKNKLQIRELYKGFYWNPKQGVIDSNCFKGVDTIINLAGSSISKRWTSSYKNEILQSRLQALELLRDTITREGHTIKQMVSASAIGIYPNSRTNYYDETYLETSTSFLGEVAQQWELEADKFSELNIKVAKVRVGLVLGSKEGALPQMLKPILWGLGAAFGSGKQWQSWIHVEDLARLFFFLRTHKMEGVYNGVAPNPVTNREFTRLLAKILKRPLLLPNIPKEIMKLVLGDMHILLLESQRVSSKKIEDSGFEFTYHHLQPALEQLLV